MTIAALTLQSRSRTFIPTSTHRFPNAQITACGLTEIANAVEPFRKNLPTVTQEIGDTWIYGVASDPVKVARYRELSRLRRSWIASGKFQSGDATDIALLRKLLLEAEHTWGTDTKTWLDFDNYIPRDLAKMLDTKNYKVVEFSWTEKRQDLFDGIATLPQPLRDEAQSAIHALAPNRRSAPAHRRSPPERRLTPLISSWQLIPAVELSIACATKRRAESGPLLITHWR